MRRNSIFTKRWVKGSAVLVATAATLVFANPQQAIATPLKGVDSATVSQSASNVVDIDFADGIKGRITFLEDGIFRYNVDPKGEFSDYATPRSKSHTAKIQAQPDTSDTYSKPSATVADKGDTIEITGGKATVILDKATGKMSIKSGDRVVVSESASLDLDKKGTVQTLAKEKSENFFGGGTQNGRFLHTNQTIAISNTNNWTDGGVASPTRFIGRVTATAYSETRLQRVPTTSVPRTHRRSRLCTARMSLMPTTSWRPTRALRTWQPRCCRTTTR